MKNKHTQTEEKELPGQKLKIAIILTLLTCSVFYFLFLLQNTKIQTKTHNHTVTYTNNVLTVFDDTYDFSHEQNKFFEHGDYFLVRLPAKQETLVYSLKQEKLVKNIPSLVIDYDGENLLHSMDGVKTYFNKTDLGVSCSTGYIQDSHHVLCIVPKEKDNLDNKLISIDPTTRKQTDIYVSDNTLSAVSYNQEKYYIGEYNLQTKQFYITINHHSTKTNTLVDAFYTMNGKEYFASLPNGWNNKTASYGSINFSKTGITVNTIKKGEIVFKK